MLLTGTMYIIDEPHIDVLKNNLMRMPPPGAALNPNTVICMDMDETDNMLEVWFPEHCQKATILCPPPSAMYKEIDGDSEGFINEYNDYLDYDSTVQEFIVSMLMYLSYGGNIILYTPSHLEDDALWTNTLLLYFFTRFGITIGTGIDTPYAYDIRYDGHIADILYVNNYMNLSKYLAFSDPLSRSPEADRKLRMELAPMAGPGVDPMTIYYDAKNLMMATGGVSLLKAAVTFG